MLRRLSPRGGARLLLLTAAVCAPLPVFAAPRQATARVQDDAGRAQETVYHFDIAPGVLDAALKRFETITGFKVSRPQGVDRVSSPGVAGAFTAAQALDMVLAGTGFTFRRQNATSFALTVAVAPQTVSVTGRLIPYRPDDAIGATKTATPLRDIPQTVAVVPRDLLIDQRAQSVADAVRNVPGVSIAQGEGNRDQVVLRGISTASDFYVNGVRDDQERFRDLYNVERVEVVQGPAAILFGRGGAGGIVNLVTRQPIRGAGSDASVELGPYGHKRATTQFGIPLAANGSLRVSAMAEDSESYRDAFFLDRYGVNPVAGFQFGNGSSLTLGFEHLTDHRLADRGIPSRAGRPVDVAPSQFFGSPGQNDARSGVDSAYGTFEHRFRTNVTLRNTFLAGRYDKAYQNVYPGSAVSPAGTLTLSAYNHDVDRTNAFNQIDVIFDAHVYGTSHTIVTGVEIGRQFQDELRHTATPIPNVPLADSMRDANFAAAPLVIDRHATSGVAAGYVQDQIAFGAHWKALVGARLDRFEVRVDDHLPGDADLSRTDVELSPRAGLIYQPNQVASFYTSYSYTFLPSGQTLGLTPTTALVGPENAKNYEAGVKLDVLEKRLAVSMAVFRLDRDNVKNTDPTDPSRLVLTGQQRADGAQLTLAGEIAPRWRVYGGYSILRARITADTTSAPAGRTVGLVPRNQLTLWSTYDFGAHVGAGAGVVSQASMFTSFTNQVVLPAFTRADAVLYYRFGRYRLAANAENLFNAKYYPTANGDNNISPGAPRNLQLSLRMQF
jgi:catecholate siderophore receptor